MKCECLFCEAPASVRLTVPHHKPRTFLCEEHAAVQLTWADRYRHIPGMVQIESAP